MCTCFSSIYFFPKGTSSVVVEEPMVSFALEGELQNFSQFFTTLKMISCLINTFLWMVSWWIRCFPVVFFITSIVFWDVIVM